MPGIGKPDMLKLLALRQKYKFIIIEDDRYANCHEKSLNDLIHPIYGKKADVIFLRTLSHICEELDAINIVTGPVRLISMLIEKLFNTNKSLPAVMASGLHMVMKMKTLHTYDNR